ncbi:MAG: hypothetical protein V8S24_01970 [Gordonibacter pamelaeae]
MAISQYSAATAVFTLASLQVKGSWLELQKDGGGSVALPSGAEFTLLNDGSSFYHYQATGTEGDNKILLDSFASMGGNADLPGTLNGDVTVVFDFGRASSQLELDEYSLRLRADTSADSTGADSR